MYTIGQISEMFQIPISTLRYYDKEGLFPEMSRSSGIRQFTDNEVETLRVIECLKRSGMEIKKIKQFMQWCAQGSSTYAQRRDMFLKQKEAVTAEIDELCKTLAMIEYKCWYYDQALAEGGEEQLLSRIPDGLPADIKAYYDLAHSG